MGLSTSDITDSVVLIGSQFSEPMRVVGNPTAGDGFVIVNLVGTRTSTFRGGVTLTKDDLTTIQIERPAARFGANLWACVPLLVLSDIWNEQTVAVNLVS